MLSTFIDTATDPRLITFLAVGLAGSVLIAAWPSLKKFAADPSRHLRRLPKQALAVIREPAADAASTTATAPLPRAVFAFGAIGVALAAWTGYAFTQPSYQKHTVPGTRWENVTSFTFTGHGPASNALPNGAVGPISPESIARSGAPPVLYSNVLSSLDFAFTYQMQSKQQLEVLGTGGAALRIKAQDGWERTVTLQPPQQLIGPDVTLWFTLNLDAARVFIAGVENETGSRSEWYDFTVVPVVRLVGQQGTEHIDETYAPEYHLRYDPVHITADATMARTEPQAGAPVQQESSRRVEFSGISLSYALARWLSGVAAIAALARAVMLVPSKPAAAPKGKAAPARSATGAASPAKSGPRGTATPAASTAVPANRSASSAPSKSAPTPAAAPAGWTPPEIANTAEHGAVQMPPTPIGAEPHTETVKPPEPSASDAPSMPRGPSTLPHAAAPPAAGAPIERRPSPETLRAAIERNLAASADMASLLADSVKAASNGGGHRSTSHASDGQPSAGEPPAA